MSKRKGRGPARWAVRAPGWGPETPRGEAPAVWGTPVVPTWAGAARMVVDKRVVSRGTFPSAGAAPAPGTGVAVGSTEWGVPSWTTVAPVWGVAPDTRASTGHHVSGVHVVRARQVRARQGCSTGAFGRIPQSHALAGRRGRPALVLGRLARGLLAFASSPPGPWPPRGLVRCGTDEPVEIAQLGGEDGATRNRLVPHDGYGHGRAFGTHGVRCAVIGPGGQGLTGEVNSTRLGVQHVFRLGGPRWGRAYTIGAAEPAYRLACFGHHSGVGIRGGKGQRKTHF